MLVLEREFEEAVIITVPAGHYAHDTQIKVQVVRSRGKVRLGLSGPPEFKFHREEVQQAIDREALASSPEYLARFASHSVAGVGPM